MMLIIVPPKRIDLLLRILQRGKPVRVQTVLAKSPIERFDHGIVRRFAASAEVEDDAVGIRPQVHRRADELGAIVAVDALRQPSLKSQPLERRRDIVATHALTSVDRQALARERVDHGQRPEATPIGELVRDEVHAPDVVACGRRPSLLTMHRRGMPPRPLTA